MPIKRARSGGFGQGNRNFPLWDLGCEMFWRAQNPTVVQCPGGITTPTYVMNDGSAQASPYLGFDPARNGGAYVRYSSTAIEMPRCGILSRTRTNYWDTTEADDRGLVHLTAGLSRSNSDAIAAGYILEPNATWPIAGTHGQCKLTNGGAGWEYNADNNTATSVSQPKTWAFLCRMSDGSAVTAAKVIPTVSVADPTAGAFTDLCSAIVYRKIRSDGWYIVSAKTTEADTDIYYGLGIAVGLSCWIEAPNLTLTSTGIPEAGFIGSTTASATNRIWRDSYLTINRPVSDTAQEHYPDCGWLACSFISPWGSESHTLASTRMVCWEVDADNRIYLGINNTTEAFSAGCYNAGASQFFMNNAFYPVLACTPYGVVCAWERRGSAHYARLFVNGVCMDTDTAFSMPTGVATTITIGKESAGLNADGWVQHAAIGRNGLSGAEAARLSLWLQSKVLHTF